MEPSPETIGSLAFRETLVARDIGDHDPRDPRASLGRGTQLGFPAPRMPRLDLALPGSGAAIDAIPVPSQAAFEVRELLGAGGMGAVYIAYERALDRIVALKTSKHPVGAPSALALQAEAVVTGQLDHPGIVPVHQLVQSADGRPVMILKRVEGVSWRELLEVADHPGWSALKVPVADRRAFHLEVLRRLCDALAFAHTRGVVHRDVKPDNVMVGWFGEVYLVDWGLAVKAGQSREGEPLVGTPAYMAPEMVRGSSAEARTDVYLLGATLFHVLTGHPPHVGATVQLALLSAYEAAPPVLGADVPVELAELCRRAMAKELSERPADANEFRQLLIEHERHRASRALGARAEERLRELELRVARASGEADFPALYGLMAECRFGFLEAQREWAENEAVPAGLQACMEAGIEIELLRRQPGAARAILSELPRPNRGLEARVATLEAELASSREEDERLKQLAELADHTRYARQRRTSFVAAVVLIIATGGATSVIDRMGKLTPFVVFLSTFPLILGGMLLVATIAKPMLASGFNRRAARFALALFAILAASRGVQLLEGVTLSEMAINDLVLIGACLCVSSIWSFKGLLHAGLFILLAAVVAAFAPAYARAVFSAAVLICAVSLLASIALRAPRAAPS